MRLRHKPKAVAALPKHPFFIKEPQQYIGKWQEQFKKPQPLSLELGCGFCGFSSEFARRYPDNNLLAVDKSLDVLVGGGRLIESELGVEVGNLKICSFDAYDIEKCLCEQDKIHNLFIFFCNPWPKRSHHRRRLTYPALLEKYQKLLTNDAKLYFKTDDEQLYRYSLRYFEQCKLPIIFNTEHLDEESGFELLSIQTEYEKKFRALGQNIYAAVVDFSKK